MVKSVTPVFYWSKGISNYQQAPQDIGIMWWMREAVLVSKVLSNQRNRKKTTHQTEMKMILQKKSTRNISTGVKRSLQWSESEILRFLSQDFLTCQDGKSKLIFLKLIKKCIRQMPAFHFFEGKISLSNSAQCNVDIKMNLLSLTLKSRNQNCHTIVAKQFLFSEYLTQQHYVKVFASYGCFTYS